MKIDSNIFIKQEIISIFSHKDKRYSKELSFDTISGEIKIKTPKGCNND